MLTTKQLINVDLSLSPNLTSHSLSQSYLSLRYWCCWTTVGEKRCVRGKWVQRSTIFYTKDESTAPSLQSLSLSLSWVFLAPSQYTDTMRHVCARDERGRIEKYHTPSMQGDKGERSYEPMRGKNGGHFTPWQVTEVGFSWVGGS